MHKLCSKEGPAGRQRLIEDCLLELMQAGPFCDITVNALCE